MLNWGDTVSRNFSRIDAINENDSHYVFPKDHIEFCGNLGGLESIGDSGIRLGRPISSCGL